jgi:glutamine amidotransferase-like uncharacterized protein
MKPTFGALACVALLGCRSPATRAPAAAPAILLFKGIGTSPNDVAAFERLLNDAGLGYATADSRQLDAMSGSQLGSHRLLIVPGGNFEQIGRGVAPATSVAVRSAVEAGLNYLGVCAGAFFAGDSPYNGLNLTQGVRFGFYSLESRGVRKAAVSIARAESRTLDHYWEDGPQLAGWGEVVAKYPDGAPAVVQGRAGKGWVVLSGIHPEAPESWRHGLRFSTPAEESNAFAAALIAAALDGARLPHY